MRLFAQRWGGWRLCLDRSKKRPQLRQQQPRPSGKYIHPVNGGVLCPDARLQSCGRRLPEMVEGRLRPASAVARCCHRFYSRCDRPVAKRFAAAAPQFLLLPPTKRGERSRLVCSCWRSNAKDASRAPFAAACTCFYLRPEVYTSSACNRSRGGSARIWPGPAPVRATFRLCAIIPGERWPRRPLGHAKERKV